MDEINSDKQVWNIINEAEEEKNTENNVRQNNLLELLQIATKSNGAGGALRTIEICELTGWSDKKVRKQLGVLKSRGLVEVVTVDVEAVDDTTRPGKAYRLIDSENS